MSHVYVLMTLAVACFILSAVNVPAKVNVLTQVSALLERHKAQISAALPRHMTPERMIRVVLTSISQTPLLQKCSANTLCGAVVQASILGLEPNSLLGEAYLVPYWNSKINGYEAQLQVGYKGHCRLARNSGEIAGIDAQSVHENDDFDFEKGSNQTLRHKWAKTGARGEIIGYWAGFKTKLGEFSFEYWSVDEILAHRDQYSKAAFVVDKKTGERVMQDGEPVLQGAWATAPDWMSKKTVLIQALKLAPKSVQMQLAIDLDNSAEQLQPQTFAPEIPEELQPTQATEPEPAAEATT